ncbi:MAG: MFS transporter, partial [Oligoflexia bacterium]|nr:MFS transporter [Oligoflexia bacterium]
GKFSIITGATGAALANLLMGGVTWSVLHQGPAHTTLADHLTAILSVLYALNMYFQSFGAVAIVKCNAPWFHVRERGVFGAIFGILISLGIYFAFDWGYAIVGNENLGLVGVFVIPAVLLSVFMVVDVFVVQNTPGAAGLEDFDTADASSGDNGPALGPLKVFRMMFTNPIIVTIAIIEFCSGFLRQSIMQWFTTFAKQTDGVLGLKASFVYHNWGMLLCTAGILGGVVAGILSDRLFQSRRGPVAALLYVGMLLGAIVMVFTYQTPLLPWLVIGMSMCVIGVHGMLSGTASMDFGGRRNVGIAVGIIDGFVYAGTAFMSILYGVILPDDASGQAADPANWHWWPISMIPIAIIGLSLGATRSRGASEPLRASEPPRTEGGLGTAAGSVPGGRGSVGQGVPVDFAGFVHGRVELRVDHALFAGVRVPHDLVDLVGLGQRVREWRERNVEPGPQRVCVHGEVFAEPGRELCQPVGIAPDRTTQASSDLNGRGGDDGRVGVDPHDLAGRGEGVMG